MKKLQLLQGRKQMSSFHVLNVTLWNVINSINAAENFSCTLHPSRESNDNTSDVVEVSMNLMLEKAIPIMLVDFAERFEDNLEHIVLMYRDAIPFSIGYDFICNQTTTVQAMSHPD